MYSRGDTFNPEVRNELAMQNLIMIAGNDNLLSKLDTNTQTDLLNFVKAYVSTNLEAIKDVTSLKEDSSDELLVEELNKLR